jgi:hypothetical protein
MTINIHPMQRTVATLAAFVITAAFFLQSFTHVPVA